MQDTQVMIKMSLMLKLPYHLAAQNRIDDNDVESAVQRKSWPWTSTCSLL